MTGTLLIINSIIFYIVLLWWIVRANQARLKKQQLDVYNSSNKRLFFATVIPFVIYTWFCFSTPDLGEIFIFDIVTSFNWKYLIEYWPNLANIIYWTVKNNQHQYWVFPFGYFCILHHLLLFSLIYCKTSFLKEFFSNLFWFFITIILILFVNGFHVLVIQITLLLSQNWTFLYYCYVFKIDPYLFSTVLLILGVSYFLKIVIDFVYTE